MRGVTTVPMYLKKQYFGPKAAQPREETGAANRERSSWRWGRFGCLPAIVSQERRKPANILFELFVPQCTFHGPLSEKSCRVFLVMIFVRPPYWRRLPPV